MMDNTYSYDKVNNILSLVNEAPQVTPNKKGGPFEYNYKYDDLYRLTHAEGDWKGATHEHRYELDMQYSPTGRILHKTQTHDRMSYDEPGTWVVGCVFECECGCDLSVCWCVNVGVAGHFILSMTSQGGRSMQSDKKTANLWCLYLDSLPKAFGKLSESCPCLTAR